MQTKPYAKENGGLNVTASYVTANEIRLGGWISNLRTCRKSGIQTPYLTAERIAALDKIGMGCIIEPMTDRFYPRSDPA